MQIVTKRHAAVAHFRPEQFGEEACLRATHGGVVHSQAQDDRDPSELRVFGPSSMNIGNDIAAEKTAPKIYSVAARDGPKMRRRPAS